MEEIVCPNCKESFKADPNKKYNECPHCRYELANTALTKNQLRANKDGLSLTEKIKRAKIS